MDAWQSYRDEKIKELKNKLQVDILTQKKLIKSQKILAKSRKIAYVADKNISTHVANLKKICQSKIQVIKKQALSESTFQGLRMTLHSTIELAQRLLNDEDFDFVLTRKLNQDPLEVFLKQILKYIFKCILIYINNTIEFLF